MRLTPYAALAAALFTAAPTQATVINGRLTTTDWLSFDDFGTFYVDGYEFTVASDTEITVSLASSDFPPYIAMWDTTVLPTEAWQGGGIDLYVAAVVTAIESFAPPGPASFTFNAVMDATYQLAVTSAFYLGDPDFGTLGDYTLTVSAAATAIEPIVEAIPDPTSVPEPTTLLLIASGLLAGAARMRRHRRV